MVSSFTNILCSLLKCSIRRDTALIQTRGFSAFPEWWVLGRKGLMRSISSFISIFQLSKSNEEIVLWTPQQDQLLMDFHNYRIFLLSQIYRLSRDTNPSQTVAEKECAFSNCFNFRHLHILQHFTATEHITFELPDNWHFDVSYRVTIRLFQSHRACLSIWVDIPTNNFDGVVNEDMSDIARHDLLSARVEKNITNTSSAIATFYYCCYCMIICRLSKQQTTISTSLAPLPGGWENWPRWDSWELDEFILSANGKCL